MKKLLGWFALLGVFFAGAAVPTSAQTLTQVSGTITDPNGWACNASDVTTANILRQSSTSPTACTIAGTVNANDVLTFTAVAY